MFCARWKEIFGRCAWENLPLSRAAKKCDRETACSGDPPWSRRRLPKKRWNIVQCPIRWRTLAPIGSRREACSESVGSGSQYSTVPNTGPFEWLPSRSPMRQHALNHCILYYLHSSLKLEACLKVFAGNAWHDLGMVIISTWLVWIGWTCWSNLISWSTRS